MVVLYAGIVDVCMASRDPEIFGSRSVNDEIRTAILNLHAARHRERANLSHQFLRANRAIAPGAWHSSDGPCHHLRTYQSVRSLAASRVAGIARCLLSRWWGNQRYASTEHAASDGRYTTGNARLYANQAGGCASAGKHLAGKHMGTGGHDTWVDCAKRGIAPPGNCY